MRLGDHALPVLVVGPVVEKRSSDDRAAGSGSSSTTKTLTWHAWRFYYEADAMGNRDKRCDRWYPPSMQPKNKPKPFFLGRSMPIEHVRDECESPISLPYDERVSDLLG